MREKQAYNLLFVCWIIAMIASLGSLFFSSIMNFVPCTLCWYQRICMYPLVLIFLTALIRFEKSVFYYSSSLIAIGWFISLYHNLVQLKIIPEEASPCVQGVPCAMKYINWLGFITIPMLSFFAFSILLSLMYLFYRRFVNEK
ncbi:MAG: disulfide oxidoreductase [Spirochaetia bacterium]|nr:disulfide oxidoreductase [Spirochaetia bacterium]